jgi:hypothetical protein
MMKSYCSPIPWKCVQTIILLHAAIIFFESEIPKISAFTVVMPRKIWTTSGTFSTTTDKFHDVLLFGKRDALNRGHISVNTAAYATNGYHNLDGKKYEYNIHLNSNEQREEVEPNNRFSTVVNCNFTSYYNDDDDNIANSSNVKDDKLYLNIPAHKSVQSPAGPLWDSLDERTHCLPHRGRSRKRVLVLCTGGTLTMSNDPTQGNSLAPVQGALTEYLATMRELTDDPEMPEIIAHEYSPLLDSSDMGPGDWAVVAQDIATNYYHFGRLYFCHYYCIVLYWFCLFNYMCIQPSY